MTDQQECPAGCGCRLGTTDPDARDCGCDGPCGWYSWDEWLRDVLERPAFYREIYEATRDMDRPLSPIALSPEAQADAELGAAVRRLPDESSLALTRRGWQWRSSVYPGGTTSNWETSPVAAIAAALEPKP